MKLVMNNTQLMHVHQPKDTETGICLNKQKYSGVLFIRGKKEKSSSSKTLDISSQYVSLF